MRNFVIAAATLTLAGTASAQTLNINGACPGPMDVIGSGFTPRGSVAILTGGGPGSDVMPGGPCAGGTTNLRGLSFITTIPADAAGNIAASPSIAGGLCGTSVQFLDASTCNLSNRTVFGAGSLTGSYQVNEGPSWTTDPPTYSCVEGCAEVFGGSAADYVCSTSGSRVDHSSYVDGWGDPAYCSDPVDHDFKQGVTYDCGAAGCSYSAYVSDHSCASVNYCYSAGAPAVDCDPATEVEYEGACYYLDGSGGVCDRGYTLAPQSVLAIIADDFTGKDYKNAISDNCCIAHRDQDIEGQDWGLGGSCNAPGPWPSGPTLGGAGCTDLMLMNPAQLTLCMSM